MQKDNDYLIKIEEANMLYERDIEALKKQVDALKEELNKYIKAVEKVDDLTVSEIEKGLSIDDINNLYSKNLQLKKALIDIKAMVEFECKCSDKETCICHVCDKYDAIITKIDGVLYE